MKKKSKNPIIFVLFGATGDLAQKKIFPALETLFDKEDLSSNSKIVAVSRRDWNDTHFTDFLNVSNKDMFDESFLKQISYSNVDIETERGYKELSLKIKNLQKEIPKSELYIYMSLAPQNHAKVVKALAREKILVRDDAKLLIEKPFGTDEKTACALDKLLLSFMNEEEIHRIDHYLGKDTLQAVMDLHESTPHFDDLLTRESVEKIFVKQFETKGIDGRGASYDHVGAFRDVGQNHMLEMLAVVVAKLRDSKGKKVSWQKARAEVFTHLAPPQKTCDLSRRGQYEGYVHEVGVKPKTETETAFRIETSLSRGKLAGVPLILESGKKMTKSEASIEIQFKDIPELPEKMIFHLQPEQKIITKYRDGSQEDFEVPVIDDAYVNVIRAALQGSSREFVGGKEIEALWSYADHIIACWGKVPLEIYSKEKPFLIE